MEAEADLVGGVFPGTNEADADVMEGAGIRGEPVRPERRAGEDGEGSDVSGSEGDEEEDRCHVCGVEEAGDDEESGEEAEASEEDAEKVMVSGHRGEEAERVKAVRDERRVKDLVDPRKPSEKEVEEHERTHLPYRNWCGVCVRGKGRDDDHRKVVDRERGLSEYSFDYCFPGDELGCKLTVLVGRERITGTYFATTVPMKGSMGYFTVEKVKDMVDEVGDTAQTIIIKTDQEASVGCLVEDVVKDRELGKTIVEQSPAGSSQSNGVVERAVQGLEGQMRVMLLALEGRVGRTVDPEEAIVTFLPEYAAYLLNRLEVGKDGKTAYERVRGKRATVVGLEFGEKVLWRKRKADRMAKLRSRWSYGVFVGIRRKSGEMWVAAENGEVVKTRAVRRLPVEERWTEECVDWVRHTPWNKFKGDPDADGEIPQERKVGPGGGRKEDARKALKI